MPDEPTDELARAEAANRVACMARFDRWGKPFRAIGNEFGFNVTDAMMQEGHHSPLELFDILEDRRDRLQRQWLDTNYITARVKDVFKRALARTRFVGKVVDA